MFKTGFCHFCGYETKTKQYIWEITHMDMDGEMWLCEFCEQLSNRDMKNKSFRKLNWGLNHILKAVRGKEGE